MTDRKREPQSTQLQGDGSTSYSSATSRPRLLDLFCGAGGCGCGYHRAGFEVVGVDIEPQPNYPFEFHQADALTFPLDGFAAIHASPPCQAYSRATAWRGDRANHPDLIATVRGRLLASELPYVIENVQDARALLVNPILLCGSMLGISVERHRFFETNWPLWQPATCAHTDLLSFDHGNKAPESAYRTAMGCDWMTVQESRESIPPAYTEWIGQQLLAHLEKTNQVA